MIIEDGKGTGYKARVDATNRLHVQSISESEQVHSVEKADAYNINSGNITLSAAGTLLYLKNNEDRDLVVDSIAVGVGTGSTSDMGEITVIRNPTAGDLISDETAVSINQNRNFASSKTLSATAYKGKSAGTITGGDDILLLYQGTDGRLFAAINLSIGKGNSVAIKIDPKLSSGSVKAYGAFICYLKDDSSAD